MSDRLSDYLKTQFTDLDGAKVFMRRWFVEMDQEIPGHGGFTIRAMAGHCAATLMGDPDAYQGFYFSMPHGPELYWAALEAPASATPAPDA